MDQSAAIDTVEQRWGPSRRLPPWRYLSSYGAGQLLGKALHELRFRLYGICPVLGRLAAAMAVRGSAPGPGELRPLGPWLLSLVAPPPIQGFPTLLSFAGETHEHRAATRWAPPGSSRLYRFHLHYMDWVASLARDPSTRDQARDLLDDWVDRNPPGSLEGWHPYCTALRLVNLSAVWGLLAEGQPRGRLGRWTDSLWRQTWFLARHRESFLGGNHLLEDDLALVAAGLLLGPRARGLLTRALRRLAQDLREQIPGDGGHAEGSYAYHVRLWRRSEAVATALRGVVGSSPPWLDGAVARMGRFARELTAELADPPLFGDAWSAAEVPSSGSASGGSAPGGEADALLFPDSCLARMRWGGPGDLILVRWGSVGAPGVPGHGHGDCGSYELFAGGRRIVADGGNLSYEADALRSYFRSTAAHNTARVAGREQSELIGAFRAGRTIRGRLVSWVEGPPACLAVSWQGVGPPLVTQRRVVAVVDGGGVLVGDGCWPESDRMVSAVHLAPEVALTVEGGAWRLDGPNRSLWLSPVLGRFGPPERVPFAPDFGVASHRTRLELRGGPVVGYALCPHRPTETERSGWEATLRAQL